MSCCKWDGCSKKKKAFVCVAALGNGEKGCTYVSGYCILCESLFTSMLRYGGMYYRAWSTFTGFSIVKTCTIIYNPKFENNY